MEKAIVDFNSGIFGRYAREVVPLEKKLKRNNKVNWAVCLGIVLLCAVAGVVAGFFIVPTILGIFTGLLGGSLAGAAILLAYYFIRSAILVKTKKGKDSGLSSCDTAYRETFAIPENAIQCNILASDFLPEKYYKPSLVFSRDDESISIIATDYRSERNEIRYSHNTVVSYSLFADSKVLVQSQEGYIVLPAAIKELFISKEFPILSVALNQRFSINEKAFQVSERPKDLVMRNDSSDNKSWEAALSALSGYLRSEEA